MKPLEQDFGWIEEMLGRERSEELHSHWRNTSPESVEGDVDHIGLLHVSAMIMAGKQEPSIIAAISTASSLQSTPAWDGLAYLASSLESFMEVQSLTPSIQILVQQTVIAAQEEISRSIDHAREREEQTLRSVSV